MSKNGRIVYFKKIIILQHIWEYENVTAAYKIVKYTKKVFVFLKQQKYKLQFKFVLRQSIRYILILTCISVRIRNISFMPATVIYC